MQSPEVLILAKRFNNQIQNGLDFETAPTTSYANNLCGSIQHIQRFYQKIRVQWFSTTDFSINPLDIQATGEINQYILTQSTGNFKKDGFSEGDKIELKTIQIDGDYFAYGIINEVSENVIVFTKSSGTISSPPANAIIHGLSPLTALIYSFGLVPNSENFSIQSLFSGGDQQFYADNIGVLVEGVRSTDWVDMTPQSNQRDWLLSNYGARIKFVEAIDKYQYFEIEHSFIINPFCLDGSFDDVVNNIIQEILKGQNSLKYTYKVDFRTTLSNPNTSKIQTVDSNLGSIADFGETFNGFLPQYQIDSISYKEAGTNAYADGILINSKTTATIVVSSINDEITANHVVIPQFCIFAKQVDYTNNFNYLNENILFDNLVAFLEATETGTNIIKEVRSTLSNGQGIIEFDIEFSEAQQLKLDETTQYCLSLSIGDSTKTNANADTINLVADARLFDNSADIEGLMICFESILYQHNEVI